MPAGLTKLGIGAFENCVALESIEIPDGVSNIEQSAFQNCSGLKSIKLPAGVTELDHDEKWWDTIFLVRLRIRKPCCTL